MKYVAFFGLGVALLAALAFAQTPITEYTVPYPGSHPQAITPGPSKDNSVWFTDPGTNSIGRAIFSGSSITIVEYPIPTPDCSPLGITAGLDGAMWFTESNANKIGRIGLDGVIIEFPLPTPASAPNSITFGSDGGVWFTESNANQIGTIGPSPNFFIREFPIPTSSSKPMGVVWNADNAVWFTEFSGNKIGRITIDGTITEFPISTPNSGPLGIGLDANLQLWFAESSADRMGSINTATTHSPPDPLGVVTEYPTPVGSSGVSWSGGGCFTYSKASMVVCDGTSNLSYENFFFEFPTPTPASNPQGITYSPSPNQPGYWFAEAASGKIARLNLSQQVVAALPRIPEVSSLPDGIVGTPNYSATLAGGGFSPPYSWSVAPGSLPPGLTLVNGTNGIATISGTPSAAGSYAITANLTDAMGATVAKTFTVQIAPSTCSYSLNPSGQTFPSIGGTGFIYVSTAPGCPWNVVPNQSSPLVRINTGASGVGSGIVSYTVGANSTVANTVVSNISVNGQSFSVQLQPGPSDLFNLFFLPVFSEGAGTSTIFTTVNASPAPQSSLTIFYGDDGNLAPVVVVPASLFSTPPVSESWVAQMLAPHQSYSFSASAPSSAPFLGGSVFSYYSGAFAEVIGFAILHNDSTRQEATEPAGGSGRRIFFPQFHVGEAVPFDNTADVQTGITVASSSVLAYNGETGLSFSIAVSFYDDSGALLGTGTLSLPPYGQTWIPLSTQFPVTANKRGTMALGPNCVVGGIPTMFCDLPPTLAVRYTTGGAATTLPPMGSGTLPHFMSGGGWQTTFVFQAGESFFGAPVSAQLNFYDDGGMPLPVKLSQAGQVTTASSITGTIPTQGQLLVQTAASATDPLVTGSVQLNGPSTQLNGQLNVAATGFAIFRYLPTGQETVVPFAAPLGAADPGASDAANSLLAFDNTNGITTTVAVANTSASATTVFVILRNEQGMEIGDYSFPLAANGHNSFDLAAAYPIVANMRGTIEFGTPARSSLTAPSPIVVTGIRRSPMGSFATLPTLPTFIPDF